MVVLLFDKGDKVHRAQAGAFRFIGFQAEALQTQSCNLALEKLEIQPRVEHRPDNHIARCAGKTIEVRNFHNRPFLKLFSRHYAARMPLLQGITLIT
jgi:hypothetical protein